MFEILLRMPSNVKKPTDSALEVPSLASQICAQTHRLNTEISGPRTRLCTAAQGHATSTGAAQGAPQSVRPASAVTQNAASGVETQVTPQGKGRGQPKSVRKFIFSVDITDGVFLQGLNQQQLGLLPEGWRHSKPLRGRVEVNLSLSFHFCLLISH